MTDGQRVVVLRRLWPILERLAKQKGRGYASEQAIHSNYALAALLGTTASVRTAILTRLADKLARLATMEQQKISPTKRLNETPDLVLLAALYWCEVVQEGTHGA